MVKLFGRKERTEDGVRRTRDSWLGSFAHLFRQRHIDEEVWQQLEEALISADVGIATTTSILDRTRERVEAANDRHPRELLLEVMREELLTMLESPDPILEYIFETGASRPKPKVIVVVGINGSGKTTSIAKLARFFLDAGDRVVLGAADTFRAAAIEQLQIWGQRLGVDVVANKPGGDAAAVAFDAVQAGKARGADVVIIDTAGRLHTNRNLMEEIRKIRRVVERVDPETPLLILLVMDATTGQTGMAQARGFSKAVACDGVFLAKLDGTAKGGVVFAIGKEMGLPVLFIGTGEGVEDLSPFDARQFVEALFTPPDLESRV